MPFLSRLLTFALFCVVTTAPAQQLALHPPDYPGVRTFIPGVFVTPVPGAPFSGSVEILSKQAMPDGSIYLRRTLNHIARNSAGVIYNERRQLVAPGFQGEPRIREFHIFDPLTRLNTFLNPETHLARQRVLPARLEAPANSTPDTAVAPGNANATKTHDLGTETIAGLLLHGTRKTRIVPAAVSGTGHDVTITDDYWYSEDLKVYLVLKHNDPRSGEQVVGIVKVDRGEPDAALFRIPAGYRVVDMTPEEPRTEQAKR
jgi:hypothetical protein